jgi:hypothetical protein
MEVDVAINGGRHVVFLFIGQPAFQRFAIDSGS